MPKFQNSPVKTALMVWRFTYLRQEIEVQASPQLDGGTLEGAHLKVTGETDHHPPEDQQHAREEHPEQSDKPRAAREHIKAAQLSRYSLTVVAAEYLAKGYTLGDHILNRAIEIDSMFDVSPNRSRFTLC